jgi:hypothetical protein
VGCQRRELAERLAVKPVRVRRTSFLFDHLLEMSGPASQSSKWQLGLEVLLEGLEQLLETVSLVDEVIQHGESDF